MKDKNQMNHKSTNLFFWLTRKLCRKLCKLEQLRTSCFLPDLKGNHKNPIYIQSKIFLSSCLFLEIEIIIKKICLLDNIAKFQFNKDFNFDQTILCSLESRICELQTFLRAFGGKWGSTQTAKVDVKNRVHHQVVLRQG